MSLSRFSVRNSVLVNMIMILIIAMGTYALIMLPRELFPQVRLNRVAVSVPFPGASPEEVEKLVTKPIEDEIRSLDHLDMYLTDSIEGQARLNIIFDSISEDEFNRVYQDLRREVEKVELPKEAEDPVFVSLESSTWMPMATVVVSGDLPELQLKELAEEVQDEIEGMQGVDSVSLAGVRDRQVWVEVDPQSLYKHNLTLEQVAGALNRQNVSLASGNIQVGNYDYLLRSIEDFKGTEEISSVVIKEDSVGNHLRIRDIAAVKDTFEEVKTLSRFNGKPSFSMNVYKASSGNTLDLVAALRKLAEERNSVLAEGVRVSVTADNSVRIVNSLDRLAGSALFGGFLVLLLLLLFLGWRNALLVCWGIPITFLLTFTFLDIYGESLNEASLFALVLVLGMIVDDAIVVVENIARYLNRGVSAKKAAILGAKEVTWPVISSSLTTIAAFLPLMLLPGAVGEWMKVIPVTVSFALLASLFESLVILPAHVADIGRPDPHRHHSWINRTIRSITGRYRKLQGLFVRRRWAFLAVTSVALAPTLLVPYYLGTDLYEDDEYSIIFVRVWMPEGTKIETTDDLLRQFERAALELPREEVIDVVTQVGRLDTESDRVFGKDVGQVVVALVEPGERSRDLDEIIQELKNRTTRLVGYREVQYAKVSTGPPVGKSVEVKIKGKDLQTLEVIASEATQFLETIPGVLTVQDDLKKGKQEVRVAIDKNRAHLVGLDASDIARQIKYAFDGITATVFHDGAEEIDVVVKFQEKSRDSLEDIVSLKIPTRSGGLVPFDNVAYYTVRRGWAEIKRFDGERAVTVEADVDGSVMSPVEVTDKLKAHFADLGARYPGYRLDFRGEFKEFQDAFNNVLRLFVIGVILMYLILAAQFRSYIQPLLVLTAVPFSFTGAMLCLLVMDYKLSINIMFGMVALSGVALNDSIVLITFINNARNRGASLHRAILTAGKRRLRPILLTTVTTIFGLLPMALGVGGKTVTWTPLANTIVWGLGVATCLILMVMPSLYVALEDIRRLFRREPSQKLAEGAMVLEVERPRIRKIS